MSRILSATPQWEGLLHLPIPVTFYLQTLECFSGHLNMPGTKHKHPRCGLTCAEFTMGWLHPRITVSALGSGALSLEEILQKVPFVSYINGDLFWLQGVFWIVWEAHLLMIFLLMYCGGRWNIFMELRILWPTPIWKNVWLKCITYFYEWSPSFQTQYRLYEV